MEYNRRIANIEHLGIMRMSKAKQRDIERFVEGIVNQA